jgi:ABC-type transporter Mla subunit MlaD
MKRFTKHEIRVGLFILIPSLILLVFIILKLGYSISTSTMDLYLKIDSIKTIKKGTLVMIKGYEIGKVVEIRPVYKPELHFLAVMRVKKTVDLYENCTAVIQNQNIIGDAVIELRNPERKEGLLASGDVLEGIEYVSLDRLIQDVHDMLASFTGTAETLQQVTAESSSGLRRLVANLNTSVSTVNSILQDSQQDILAILASFRVTARTMEQIAEELRKNPMRFIMRGDRTPIPEKKQESEEKE